MDIHRELETSESVAVDVVTEKNECYKKLQHGGKEWVITDIDVKNQHGCRFIRIEGMALADYLEDLQCDEDN